MALKDVEQLLDKKESIFLSICGKTGSGKSEFTRQLGTLLENDQIEATCISSDDFFKDNNKDNKIIDKELEVARLQETIVRLQSGEAAGKYRSSKIIIVEGFQVIDNKVLGQKPDRKIYIETAFDQRLGRRLLRDEKTGYRSAKENLKLWAKLSVDNPDIIRKFEGAPDMSGVDLLVHNTYEDSGAPEVYLSGNTLTFSVGGEVKETVPVSDEQLKALIDLRTEVK